jgi:hypothetical protein
LVGILQKWPDKITIFWNIKKNLNIQLENVDQVFAASLLCVPYTRDDLPWSFLSAVLEANKVKIQKGSVCYWLRLSYCTPGAMEVTPANNWVHFAVVVKNKRNKHGDLQNL